MLSSIASQMYQYPTTLMVRVKQIVLSISGRAAGDALTWLIEQLMAHGKYAIVVDLGKWAYGFLVCHSRRLTSARSGLYYGLALIYVGSTAEGMMLLRNMINDVEAERKLERAARHGDPRGSDRQRNYILGRAHNNLGYAYWMSLGDYESALEEYRVSLRYFSAARIREEYANTCDNLGRVYTALGDHNRAQRLLDKAIWLRRNLGPKYRYRLALSFNSKAIYHLTFGEITQAADLAREALEMCQQLGNRRGIGLASITLGRALRHMAGQRPDLSMRKRLDLLCEAKRHLLEARAIFERSVQEPIRLVEIDTELSHLRHEWDVAPTNELVVTCPLES